MDWVEKAGKAIEPIVEAGVETAAREARRAAFIEAAAMAEAMAHEEERATGWPLWGDPDRHFASALAKQLRAAAEKGE